MANHFPLGPFFFLPKLNCKLTWPKYLKATKLLLENVLRLNSCAVISGKTRLMGHFALKYTNLEL